MLFWCSILLDLIITIVICCFIPMPWVIPTGIATYSVLSVCTVLLTLFLSMRLGKSGPRELKEILNYNIAKYDNESYSLEYNGKLYGPFSMRSVDHTIYVKDLKQPYAEVYQHSITGWRRRWLKEFYDDIYIIKLFLPDKDET